MLMAAIRIRQEKLFKKLAMCWQRYKERGARRSWRHSGICRKCILVSWYWWTLICQYVLQIVKCERTACMLRCILEHRACKRISWSIFSCSSAGDSHTEGATVFQRQMMSQVQTNSCQTLQTKDIRSRICRSCNIYMPSAAAVNRYLTFCANIRRYWRLRAQVHNMLMVTPFRQQ